MRVPLALLVPRAAPRVGATRLPTSTNDALGEFATRVAAAHHDRLKELSEAASDERTLIISAGCEVRASTWVSEQNCSLRQ